MSIWWEKLIFASLIRDESSLAAEPEAPHQLSFSLFFNSFFSLFSLSNESLLAEKPEASHQLSHSVSNSSNLERNREQKHIFLFCIPHFHISYFVRLNSKLLSGFHHSQETYIWLAGMSLAHQKGLAILSLFFTANSFLLLLHLLLFESYFQENFVAQVPIKNLNYF